MLKALTRITCSRGEEEEEEGGGGHHHHHNNIYCYRAVFIGHGNFVFVAAAAQGEGLFTPQLAKYGNRSRSNAIYHSSCKIKWCYKLWWKSVEWYVRAVYSLHVQTFHSRHFDMLQQENKVYALHSRAPQRGDFRTREVVVETSVCVKKTPRHLLYNFCMITKSKEEGSGMTGG